MAPLHAPKSCNSSISSNNTRRRRRRRRTTTTTKRVAPPTPLLLISLLALIPSSGLCLSPARAWQASLSALSLSTGGGNSNSSSSSSEGSSSSSHKDSSEEEEESRRRSSSNNNSSNASPELLWGKGLPEKADRREVQAARSLLSTDTKIKNGTQSANDPSFKRVALVDDWITYRTIPCIILMGIPMFLVFQWGEGVTAAKAAGTPGTDASASSQPSGEKLLAENSNEKLPLNGSLQPTHELPAPAHPTENPPTDPGSSTESKQPMQLPQRPSEPTSPGRLAVIDNAKFLLVFIVLWEHVEGYGFQTPKYWRIMYFTDPFVTRAFAFASGLVCKDQMSKKFLETVFFRLFLPWFFYETVIICLLWSPMADVDIGLHATIRRLGYDLKFNPNPGWYLLGLVEWRLISATFNWMKLSRPQQMAIALTLAAFSSYGGEALGLPFIDWDTTSWNLQTLPGYLFAQALPLKEALEKVPAWSQNRLLGAIVFFTIIFMQTVNFPMPNDYIPTMQLFTTTHGIPPGDSIAYPFVWLRSTYRVCLEAVKSLLFIFCVCPRSDGWMAYYGQYTIYPYIIHMLLLPPYYATLKKVPWFIDDEAYPVLSGTLQYVFLTIALFSIEFVLSTAPVRYLFGPLVEPVWAQRLYHRAINRK